MQRSLGVPRDVAESSLVQSVKRAGEGENAGRRDTLGRGEKGKTPAQKDARTSGKGSENHVIW